MILSEALWEACYALETVTIHSRVDTIRIEVQGNSLRAIEFTKDDQEHKFVRRHDDLLSDFVDHVSREINKSTKK